MSAVVVAAIVLAACGSSNVQPLASSSILSAHPGARSVDLDLVAGDTGSYGGFNFDGYSEGAMRVSIPTGWTVNVTCTNASTTLTNSCAVVLDWPLSPHGAPLAFVGASTADPSTGLGLRDTSHFHFLASRPGTYRIVSLVDGYETDGIWDWLDVTRGGSPSVRT